MIERKLKIVFFGLSITSSWGNGHATTYRSLIKELDKAGHDVIFMERNKPWYAKNRDFPNPPFCKTYLYDTLDELSEYQSMVQHADLVIVGSFVPDGIELGKWVIKTAGGIKAFYDIDTPRTLADLSKGELFYLNPELISKYDMYLSFSGGPALDLLEEKYQSPKALPFYCSVDTELYFPLEEEKKWDLGYMGTYSDDRQPPLNRLMLDATYQWEEGKFVVVGPQYPDHINWNHNVQRIEHLPPDKHNKFYNQQRFTLNITRADMIAAGYSPSVRLFEAAACGTPIISDWWEGLDTVFNLNTEILISRSPSDTIQFLQQIPEDERKEIGRQARKRILAEHTAAHRARQLEEYVLDVNKISV